MIVNGLCLRTWAWAWVDGMRCEGSTSRNGDGPALEMGLLGVHLTWTGEMIYKSLMIDFGGDVS